jgi:ubiquinone/menaquinone biosynthesis C-methylase UbiE
MGGANWYRSVFDYNQFFRDDWVAAQAARVPVGARVLDVGAGIGKYRRLFDHCKYETHDFGEEPSTIGQYTQLDYKSDVIAIPMPDESFDVVLCTEVLEHVPEPIKAVGEMARILRPNGRLLLTAPLGSILHQEPYHFYGGYTPHWYRRFLPTVGLAVEDIEANGGFFRLFGQEARRFSALVDPRRTAHTTWLWPGLVALWLVTLPFLRLLFPLLGAALDRLGLERVCTAGYHVTAVKRER